MRGVLALSVFVSVPTVQVVTCGLSFSAEARRFTQNRTCTPSTQPVQAKFGAPNKLYSRMVTKVELKCLSWQPGASLVFQLP